MVRRKNKNNKSGGFTIVELLIIIVVIGILAGLVMNHIAGAQRKAKNAATVVAVKAYITATRMYLAENDKYPDAIYINPSSTSSVSACLGQGYEDTDGDGNGDCLNSALRQENPALNNELQPYLPTPLPRINDTPIVWNGAPRRGAFIVNRPTLTVDGFNRPYHIEYYLEGDTNCGIVALKTSPSYPTMTSTNPANNTGVLSGNTRCIISLANP